MADRGRDLTLKVVSDTSQVDLSDVATDLEDIGAAADDASRDLESTTDELKRLAAQGKDAEAELKRLDSELKSNRFDEYGKDAKAAANKVDDAFDAMARSAKQGMDKVDKEGKEGFKDLKEEAHQSGRESAASFTGSFDDITSTVQEIAANAFGGFGALGAAAGLAAGAGIGVIATVVSAAKERLDELRKAFVDVQLAGDGMGGAVTAVLDNLKENGSLVGLRDDANKLGVEWGTLVRAMAGSASDLDKVAARMDDLERAGAGNIQTSHGLTNAFGNINRAVGLHGTALADASKEARAYQDGMSGVAPALDDTTAATKELTDAQVAHNAQLESTKAAMGEVGDAAVELAVKEADSIDDIIEAQDKALRAQKDFAGNTKEVLREVGQDGVEWAKQFGENAPRAMQMLADAPKKKQQTILKQYRESGKLATTSTAEGMTADIPKVETAAQKAHTAAQAEMEKPLNVPVKVGNGTAAARLAWRDAQNYLNGHPLVATVHTAPGMLVNGRKVT